MTSFEVGDRPWGIALSPDEKLLFTANGPSNDVSVVDVATHNVIKKIKVGEKPWGVLVVGKWSSIVGQLVKLRAPVVYRRLLAQLQLQPQVDRSGRGLRRIGFGAFEAQPVIHFERDRHLRNRVAHNLAIPHAARLGDHPTQQRASHTLPAKLRTHVRVAWPPRVRASKRRSAQHPAASPSTIASTSVPPGGAYAPGSPATSDSKF